MSLQKSNYKQHTIGSLMQALKQALQENKYLSLDSPVMISDYNMSGFKYDFDLIPTFSQEHKTAGLCLFHSLGQKEIYVEPSYDTESGEDFFEEEEKEDSSVMKFAKWLKE